MDIKGKLRGLLLYMKDVCYRGFGYANDIRSFRQSYMTQVPSRIDRIFESNEFPTMLEVEVTTVCNLKCRICEHSYWSEKSQHMPFEKFKGILDQFPKVTWIGLTGIGESFMNPDFLDMVKLVKGRGAYLELYDTFYFIDEKTANFLLDVQCDKLIISLDAATAETYHKIRIGSDFQRVVGNLKRMFELKKRRGVSRMKLEFHFIVNSINIDEMVPFVRLAKEISKEESPRVLFTRMLHFYKETEDLFVEIPKHRKDEVLAVAKEIGVNVDWSADAVEDKPCCSKCTAWIMPFIFVTGEVIPCCAANEANSRARQKALSMGNIFETPMKEIWDNGKYTDLKNSLYKGKFPEVCQDCCVYKEGSHRLLPKA